MRPITIVALVAAMSASALAQSIERVIDVSSLGWGALDMPIAIDTDGDPHTREWLIRTADARHDFRVIAERGEALCVGAWFHPVNVFASVSVQRVGPVHKLVLMPIFSSTVTLVSLDTPACP